MSKILVTGARGQIGSDLVTLLRQRHGPDQVIATDLRPAGADEAGIGPVHALDVRDADALADLVARSDVETVYHLASLLSATGEQNPDLSWDVNLQGLRNVLSAARERGLKVFWPSSIAVFGPDTPRENTPQSTVLEPTTMYGITKVAGELLCRYHAEKYGVDVRSVRFPGIVSHSTPPGGGTTDYAVHIFYDALRHGSYVCFVRPDTRLPMMYMPDAVRSILEIMDAPSEVISVRTSYNLSAMSFTAEEIAAEIRRHLPEFVCRYEPDFRQAIADSWPRAVDDARARSDWGWRERYGLAAMVEDMLQQLSRKLEIALPTTAPR
jgi:nucleoside-diphosphate-sugar epimerase